MRNNRIRFWKEKIQFWLFILVALGAIASLITMNKLPGMKIGYVSMEEGYAEEPAIAGEQIQTVFSFSLIPKPDLTTTQIGFFDANNQEITAPLKIGQIGSINFNAKIKNAGNADATITRKQLWMARVTRDGAELNLYRSGSQSEGPETDNIFVQNIEYTVPILGFNSYTTATGQYCVQLWADPYNVVQEPEEGIYNPQQGMTALQQAEQAKNIFAKCLVVEEETAPTPAPTEAPTPAPTEAPTPEPTLAPLPDLVPLGTSFVNEQGQKITNAEAGKDKIIVALELANMGTAKMYYTPEKPEARSYSTAFIKIKEQPDQPAFPIYLPLLPLDKPWETGELNKKLLRETAKDANNNDVFFPQQGTYCLEAEVDSNNKITEVNEGETNRFVMQEQDCMVVSAALTLAPTEAPTPEPTVIPTEAPTPVPTEAPTPEPTATPIPSPTSIPVEQCVAECPTQQMDVCEADCAGLSTARQVSRCNAQCMRTGVKTCRAGCRVQT